MNKLSKGIKKSTNFCDHCYSKGYVIFMNGNFANARICDCINDCNECEGRGSIINRSEKGYTYVSPCNRCGFIRRNVKLYNLSGIPSKYHNVLLVDSFKPGKLKSHQIALQYVKSFVLLYPEKKGFLLMGASGSGKTHLAVGAISELTLEHGVPCTFKDFFYLLSELKEAYSRGTSENEIILPLIDAEVLVIDELGKAKSSDWELNILDQLISKRYNSSKVTLITTNYISSKESEDTEDTNQILEIRVGERISSRLYEMCKFIHLKGEDYRKKI